ncbi:hypothetical protein [Streptomyces sp. NPDC090025]|uniref:hypothetical protein n=1 Tax=Streptomyces sp. NPDC090025 TaxID=3365922 RepID=UPI0038390386
MTAKKLLTKKFAHRTAGAVAAGLLALAGTLAGAGTAQAAYVERTHTLWDGATLQDGQHVSTDYARLIMQPDGNLVFYRTDRAGDWSHATPKWHTNTYGCGRQATMQSDGRLVVRGANGRECASVGRQGKDGYANACLQVTQEQGLHIWYTNRACGTFSGLDARSTGEDRAVLYSDLY